MSAFNNASSTGAQTQAVKKYCQNCLPILHPLPLEYRLLPNEIFSVVRCV